MNVHIEYKNRKLETVAEDTIDFEVYCKKLSQDLISILTDMEAVFDDNQLEDNPLYHKLRHRLFDVSGAISRLPNNIVAENTNRLFPFFKG